MLVEAEEKRMVEEEQWWKKQEMRQVERKKVGERKQILNGVVGAGGAVEEDGGEGAAGVVEMKEERKVLKKFFAGRREELQMSREAMSESLGHRLRQPDERGKKLVQSAITQEKQPHNTRNYPGSDLLSLGVLRPVPEQQLRIPLTRVQSPYGHYNTQLSWSSFTRRELHHPGYPTRSSFNTEGNNNTVEALPGLPSTQKGTTTTKISNKDKPLDQASTS
ncbi:hypothetical protein Taro_021328 [Colocasia esculenta]|uniref:Uncharacterized protein n=1 Tax=Colocasia esculenta TaxID=4460 RepID=A0A843UYK9_COLES|nr:hypothetical protein [Colocasia esculenta]